MMMKVVISGLCGLIFGLGLIISGMTNPAKVQGFLDLGGLWDPSLALVMGGALIVGLIGFTWAKRRTTAILGDKMQIPTQTVITPRLVWGSLAFGAGWGLAGFCPGPALVSLGAWMPQAVIFCLAMLAGMVIFEGIERMRSTSSS